MSKVFVVTKGRYSDYRIVGVFDDRDLASRLVDAENKRSVTEYSDTAIIEPYELNPSRDLIEAGKTRWKVIIFWDDFVVDLCCDDGPVMEKDEVDAEQIWEWYDEKQEKRRKAFFTTVVAGIDEKQRAIKVASERLACAKAEERDKIAMEEEKGNE